MSSSSLSLTDFTTSLKVRFPRAGEMTLLLKVPAALAEGTGQFPANMWNAQPSVMPVSEAPTLSLTSVVTVYAYGTQAYMQAEHHINNQQINLIIKKKRRAGWASQWAAPVFGLCGLRISSYLQVPSMFNFLSWLPSVMESHLEV